MTKTKSNIVEYMPSSRELTIQPRMVFAVDSGQFAIGDYDAMLGIKQDGFSDKRKPHHKPTGNAISPRYLGNWEAVIPEYNKTLNQIDADGDLDMRLPENALSNNMLSYDNISTQTIHAKHRAAIFQSTVYASTTAHGDGCYPVYADDENEVIVVVTDIPPAYDDGGDTWPEYMDLGELNASCGDAFKVSRQLMGRLNIHTALSVCDPGYSPNMTIEVPHGQYQVVQLRKTDTYKGMPYTVIMGVELSLVKD